MELYDYEINNPHNNEEENECLFCGVSCHGNYCCNEHKWADLD